MKNLILLFTTSVLILLVAFYFGYNQIDEKYEISESVKRFGQPLHNQINTDLLERINLPNE